MKPKPAVVSTAIVTVEPDGVEVLEGNPKWDRARKLRDEVKQIFLRSIDAQVMLGGELLALKNELGFNAWGGDRKSRRHDAVLIAPSRTWHEWCQAELGISERTAQRFIACFKLIQDRAKRLGEDSPACRLLETPANELADTDYKVLSQVLHHLIGEQSQAELLREFNLLRRPNAMQGGDTSQARKANLAKMTPELASSLWKGAFEVMAAGADAILKFRRRQDLELWLYLIPLVSGDPAVIGLIEYRDKLATILEDAKDDLEAILKKMDGFIEAKHESANAPVKRVRRKKEPTTNTKRKP